MLLSIARFISFMLLANLHPFHVSVCEVYHNPQTNSLEISMKLFIDDLEMAIQHQGIEMFTTSDLQENKSHRNALENYLHEQFQVMVNNKEIPLQFVGFEMEGDALLCYMEGTKIKKVSVIEIKNTLITAMYDDQINLTHFQYNGEMKSIKTAKENPSGTIDTSGW